MDSDLQMLEDILDLIMHEVTPGRLSAYPSAVPFTFVNVTYTGKAVEVLFESYLYKEHPIISSTSVYNKSALLLRTRDSQYLVHPHCPSLSELSVNEVSMSADVCFLLVLLVCPPFPPPLVFLSLSPLPPFSCGGGGCLCSWGGGINRRYLSVSVCCFCVYFDCASCCRCG